MWVSDSFGPKISGERAAHRSLRTLKRVAGVGVLPCFSGFKLCFFCALHRWQKLSFLRGPCVSFLALLASRGLLFVVCLGLFPFTRVSCILGLSLFFLLVPWGPLGRPWEIICRFTLIAQAWAGRSFHHYSGHEARYTNRYQSGLDQYHEARYILSGISLDLIFFCDQRTVRVVFFLMSGRVQGS